MATVSIAANDADAGEPSNNGQFTVTQTLAADVATVLTYSIGGTAAATEDYTPLTGTVTIAAGATTAVIDVTVVDNTILESSETVIVTLTGITSGDADVSLGSTLEATVTISDDDAASLSIANVSGKEDDGPITVTVVLNNAVQGGFAVDVKTSDGTATLANSDYTPIVSQTLTFQGIAGEEQSFTVMPVSDSFRENDETLTVSLLNLSVALPVDITDDAVVTIVNDDASLAGTVKYFNALRTVMNKVTIKLTQGTTELTTITDENGAYTFPNVGPGTYNIQLTTAKDPGSINASDAVQVLVWASSGGSLETVRFLSGDVSGNEYIQATDAQAIQQYWVNKTAFGRYKYAFWRANETLNGNPALGSMLEPMTFEVQPSDMTMDFFGMVTGDFNMSYTPEFTKSTRQAVDLRVEGELQAGAGEEVILPIRMVEGSKVAAVSLALLVPTDLVSVEDVAIAGRKGKLDWSVRGNELRIGWHSLSPLDLSAGDELLVLKLRTSASFTKGLSIDLKLSSDPMNELADGTFTPLGEARLSAAAITGTSVVTAVVIPDGHGLSLTNFPNPFTDYTNLRYEIPSGGKVELTIFNAVGSRVKTLVQEFQPAGEYTVRFDASGLVPGLYTARLMLRSGEGYLVKSVKIMNQ